MNRRVASITVTALLACALAGPVAADDVGFQTTLRGNQDLMAENPAPTFSEQEQSPTRRVRDYPMQPPTIPHSIEGFMVTRAMNQCVMCHGAAVAPQMKAPAIAVSHYQNRDGEYLRGVSPRRYFCTQCHVPQVTKPPLVDNTF